MNASVFRVCAVLAAMTVGCRPAERTGAAASDSLAQSAAQYTQRFYVWYGQHHDRMDIAISQGAAFFSPELIGALRADQEASARSPDEVVGLDWDPFTASQDQCDPYKIGQTTRRGDTVLVAVKGMCADAAPGPDADVVAELRRSGASWVFVNFRYPDRSGNLLADLDTLRAERDRSSAQGKQH